MNSNDNDHHIDVRQRKLIFRACFIEVKKKSMQQRINDSYSSLELYFLIKSSAK